MAVYIFLFINVILCCYLEIYVQEIEIRGKKYNLRKIVTLYLLSIFLFIGIFRDQFLGVDVNNYSDYFHISDSRYSWFELFTNFKMDNGYYLLNKIFKRLFNNYWLFKSFLYTLTFAIYYKVIASRSKYVSLSFLVFIGIERMVGIFCLLRQETAMAITFYSVKYIEEKKPFKFVFFVLLASTFHKTALLFLFSYIFVILKDETKKQRIFKYLALPLLALIFGYFIVLFLIYVYPIDYMDDITFGAGTFKLSYIIIILIACIFVLYKSNQKTSLSFNLSYCSLFPQILTLYLPLFTRITNYFLIWFTILIPETFEIIKKKSLKFSILLFVLISIFFGFLFFYSIEGIIVPYKFQF